MLTNAFGVYIGYIVSGVGGKIGKKKRKERGEECEGGIK
jgi:hypothetical protein